MEVSMRPWNLGGTFGNVLGVNRPPPPPKNQNQTFSKRHSKVRVRSYFSSTFPPACPRSSLELPRFPSLECSGFGGQIPRTQRQKTRRIRLIRTPRSARKHRESFYYSSRHSSVVFELLVRTRVSFGNFRGRISPRERSHSTMRLRRVLKGDLSRLLVLKTPS